MTLKTCDLSNPALRHVRIDAEAELIQAVEALARLATCLLEIAEDEIARRTGAPLHRPPEPLAVAVARLTALLDEVEACRRRIAP